MSHSNTVHCVVCNKPIKRGKPGTCMHETGLDHHLACPLPPETEAAIHAHTEKVVREAQLSILRGFRRRDFAREDMYESAVLDRVAQLSQKETKL